MVQSRSRTALNVFIEIFGFIPPDRSVLDGCSPVEPGTVLTIDLDSGRMTTATLRPAALDYQPVTLAEVEERLDALLQQAIERRLDNNPFPTALLSGGIDSTVVVEKMIQVCRSRGLPFRLLTLGAVIPFTNDEFYARYAAHRLGVRLEIIRPGSEPLSDFVQEALDHQDEPLAMLSFMPLYRLVKSAAEHSRILIGGDGGDEVFLGYGQAKDWTCHRSSNSDSRPNLWPTDATDLDVGLGMADSY